MGGSECLVGVLMWEVKVSCLVVGFVCVGGFNGYCCGCGDGGHGVVAIGDRGRSGRAWVYDRRLGRGRGGSAEPWIIWINSGSIAVTLGWVLRIGSGGGWGMAPFGTWAEHPW